MKLLLVICLISLTCGEGNSLPQYGQPAPKRQQRPAANVNEQGLEDLPEGCRIEYVTVSEIEEVEKEEQECKTAYRRRCETKSKKKCSPRTERKCRREYKEHCETKYDVKCKQLVRNVQEEYEEDECVDRYVEACQKRWVQIGYNDKVWQEDPSTCKELPKTECKSVTKTRTKKVPYTDCRNESFRECTTVPEQKCEKITKQICNVIPWQVCEEVPYQECENKHTKSPVPVSKRVPIRICGKGGGTYGSSPTVDVFDERNVDVIRTRQIANNGGASNQRENKDVVVFPN